MAELQHWSKLLPTAILSIIFGTMSFFVFLISIVKNGTGAVFHQAERKERPAVMDDPALGVHKTVQLKDVKIHYVMKGDEGKPLMLFVHGFPECWYSWRHQIQRFSGDYRTVAMDMRGYCESDKPYYVSSYSLDKLVEDLRQLIPALGYEKCVLVGHDWGGAVCSTFAQMHPEYVDRLILMNVPHGQAFQKHMSKNLSQLRKSWYMFFFQIPYLPELILSSEDYKSFEGTFTQRIPGSSRAPCTPDDMEAYKYALSQPGGMSGPINFYRAAFRYKSPVVTAPKITMPSLLIWGVQDAYLEKQMAELSADYHTDHTLNWIPTASHWVMMDEPEQVNECMANFLSGKKAE